MTKRLDRIKKAPSINPVGQTVRIRTENMKFVKGFEQKWALEVFTISKVLRRSPRTVYEIVNLRCQPIDGQFYAEELTSVKQFSPRTATFASNSNLISLSPRL